MARILIIDDEETIRVVIKLLLEQAGHEVIEASDGETGWRLLREHQADLIISDVVMPELNGFSLIKRLGREYPKIRIIVMSGFGGEDYALRASELGAHRVLEKPFNLQELLKAVEDLLSK